MITQIELDFFSILIVSTILAVIFLFFGLLVFILRKIMQTSDSLEELSKNIVIKEDKIFFPYTLLSQNILDITLPKYCLLCGSEDFKGHYKLRFGGLKHYILIPLCDKHYSKVKPFSSKISNTITLKSQNIGMKTILVLIIYSMIIFSFLMILFIVFPTAFFTDIITEISLWVLLILGTFYMMEFMYKSGIISAYTSRMSKNLNLHFIGDSYFTFNTLIGENWVNKLRQMNPQKEFEVKKRH